MAVLNNEVSILNIANIDNDIKDASTRAMIAGEELMEYATKEYDTNEYFIWNDRKLYKTTERINPGTALVIGGNIEYVGTVAAQLQDLYNNGPENVKDYISNVEDTNNASRAYEAGEYIIWNDGLLYRVTTNLSVGTLWREGVNLERVDNLTSVINELEKKTDGMTNNLIATIEKTNMASRNYAEGEQFVYNGVLYRATQAINKNATITPNTNCEVAENLSEQIGSYHPRRVALNHNNSTITSTSGTVITARIVLTIMDNYIIDASVFDIKLKDVAANIYPFITVKNAELVELHDANFTANCIRGSVGNVVAADGAYIDHIGGTDTIEVQCVQHIGAAPAGYFTVTR